MGMIKEASRITQWWSETQTISNDSKIMMDYISEYFRKYAGRGLPEIVDIVVATRVSGSRSGGGLSQDAVREIVNTAKNAFTAQINQLKQELGAVKSELGRVKNTGTPGGPGTQRPGNPNIKCHYCGETGHVARFCPLKKKEEEEKKEQEGKADE